jgi:antitoxin component of RelBE/YafQ-DinJ toxin-antitoxin module
MKARLTLRIDREVLLRTKDYSNRTGVPISNLVNDFFEKLFAAEDRLNRKPASKRRNAERGRKPET